MISVGFLKALTLLIVQNNKPVFDSINGLNKRRKATSASTFDLSTLYTKLKLLMALNSLIDFCFDEGENKYIRVNDYGARWVKNNVNVLTNSK